MFSNLSGHSLVGLASGDLLIIGGHQQPDGDTNYDFSSEIWRKSAIDGSVTKAGDLKRVTLAKILVMILFNNLAHSQWISTRHE